MNALIVSKGKDVLLALAVIDPALMLLMECPAEYSALPGFIWAITPVTDHADTGKPESQANRMPLWDDQGEASYAEQSGLEVATRIWRDPLRLRS